MRRLALFASGLVSLFAFAGCAADSAGDEEATDEGAFSSDQATLLDFEFDGSLVTDSSWNDKQTIQDQLLYTIGHLNAQKSVGRLDTLELTNITKTNVGGKIEIRYHAKLPVAWGSKTNLPATYEFKLPKDVSFSGQQAFTEAHKHTCVDWAAHDVDTGSMWYYYRPARSGCQITDAEVVKVTATATRSTLNTTGKYPELHKVWEDDRLEVISIFGKNEATGGASDVGVSAFNSFVRMMKTRLGGAQLSTEPANVSDRPGPDVKDVTVEGTLPDGKKVKVTALLVDAITSVWAGFDARYESLTPTADLIMYNGHAGLGQNVRALARKGRWLPGKYQMFFMNGCDTFAYVDGSLAQTRAALNPDDPSGTKYMEFITNAMPSYFHSMAAASTAMVNGLLEIEQPKTYDKIFENIDRAEVVLVTGEEDNVYEPGMPLGSGGGGVDPDGEFTPFEESGSVARNEEKAYSYDAPAGTYTIVLSGTGDADLYVKKNAPAAARVYDCRPYKNGSAETCEVTFDVPGKLHVMVRGYAASSTFTVKGSKP
ncbi:MAG: PPC domain-containing protein [Labilithrix sp.]|nr:PPC domain-containing protein [Labilithrix sp.]MCW5833047.1 PPC domain-containing protein [Labilithrix sp.]